MPHTMNTAELQFNIIYTPHTAEYLLPLLDSLLQWTDCRYRIIANGCDADEQALLQAHCETDERFDYLLAPGEEMTDHGSMLNWLQAETDSDWFCFMDSDIFASGEYLPHIAACMQECDVYSTGHPLWYAPEDIALPPSFRRLHGIHFGTTDGKRLGGTYFAVYNNRVLGAALQKYGVDFRIYRWEKVPEQYREKLQAAGLDKLEYDTGMLLMSLMQIDGVRFMAEDLPQVRHLGGFSSRAEDEPAYYYRGKPDRIAVSLLGGALSTPLLHLADCYYAWRRPSPGVTPAESRTMPFAERRILEGRIRKRRNTARYFKALMQSLRQGDPEPPLPKLGHAPAERRIAAVRRNIIEIYGQ